jgi:hypothetical protein
MMPRVARPVAAMARLGCMLAALCTLAILALGLDARARAHELMQDAGSVMLGYADTDHFDPARTLVLNGTPLHLRSGSTADSVSALLDIFHQRCKRVGAGLGQLAAPGALSAREALHVPALDGVLRLNDERGGYVACLDLRASSLTITELRARVRAFIATGDAGAVGDVRLLWARRQGQHTSYVALWSEGRLPLQEMFPTSGDAPGRDAPDLPRPRGARRTLSAWQQDAQPLLVSYGLPEAVTAVAPRYRAELAALGFRVRQVADQSGVLLLQRGLSLASATLADDGHGGSRLTLVPLR